MESSGIRKNRGAMYDKVAEFKSDKSCANLDGVFSKTG